MNYYKTLFSIFLVVFSFQATSQEFSGEIVYKQSCESKNPEIPSDVITSYMGDRHNYFYSNGNYMSIVNGNREKTSLYLAQDEKLYNYSKGRDSINVIDTSHENEKLIRYELNENVANILGRSCDELIMYTEKSIVKYYFDPNLRIDPKHFKNHIYSHWNLYTKLAKSLPLKYIMEFNEFVATGEAIEIKKYEINEDFFALPE